MQRLRHPGGATNISRTGAQHSWLRGPVVVARTPVVARATGATSGRINDASQDSADSDPSEPAGRVLRPRRAGSRRDADDDRYDDEASDARPRPQPRQRLFNDDRQESGAGVNRAQEDSESREGDGDGAAGRPSTSGRDRSGDRDRYDGPDRRRDIGYFDSSSSSSGGYGRRDSGEGDGDRPQRQWGRGGRGGGRRGGGRGDRGYGGRSEVDRENGGRSGGAREYGSRSEGGRGYGGRSDGGRGYCGRTGGSRDGGSRVRDDDSDLDERRGRDRYDRRGDEWQERAGGRGRGDAGAREGFGGGGRHRSERFDGPPPSPRYRDRTQGEPSGAADGAVVDGDREDQPPAVPAPRPPGSSTGNRPLPYDLPIVRPYDGDKGTFFAGSGWRQVGASEEVVAALRTLGIQRPSHIQAQAFTSFLGEPDRSALMLADQAGSGKTLAYLLPLLQTLRQEEIDAGGRVTKPRCPRGIVVAPTIELVQQVLRVARALSGAGLRCRSAAFTGGQRDDRARAASFRTQKDLLSEGVDLIVATPGRLQQHLEAGSLELSACRALVLDEVDVLMGDRADFLSQVAPLRAASPASMRFVLVTATLPQHVFGQLKEVWTDLEPVFGPGLHRTAAGLVEELVDCSGGEEITEESGRKRKLEALQALLERHGAARTMVFCNKIESCRDVENYLGRVDPKQQKYRILPYHEAIRDELRSQTMTQFLKPVQQPQPGREGQQQGQEGGEVPLVLVATDRTSRGIDVLYCDHVVLFDFPRDPSEYVRRVGRTARGAGGRGTVSSLVLGRQVPLAKEIIDRNQKGMPVHTVPA